MSLITQFRGDIKSGKTLSAVYWAKRLAGEFNIPVFTNMKECKYKGQPWATTITLDDLMVDVMHTDLNDASIKMGVLLLDEAHVYWEANNMRSVRGPVMTAMISQAGKRGLIIVYTTHIAGMVGPKVRELTQMQIKCKTSNEGHSILWNVRDPREWREAIDENKQPPADYWHVLYDGHRQFGWYDTDEPIDPFAAMRAAGASKANKAFLKQLEKRQDGDDETVPVLSFEQRLELANAAGALEKREGLKPNAKIPRRDIDRMMGNR